jgi:hypothetical protein
MQIANDLQGDSQSNPRIPFIAPRDSFAAMKKRRRSRIDASALDKRSGDTNGLA